MGVERKLLFFLGVIYCIGWTSARYTPWAAGNEYIYRMRSISTSDIPNLGPQAAGVKFESQLKVRYRDPTSIIVQLVDITSRKFHGDVKEVWEEIDAASLIGSHVVFEGKALLERPFIMNHREGLFASLTLSQDEPLWSINMKKAIASKLQLHVSRSRSSGSAPRNFGDPYFDDPIEDVNSVFKVYEDGVTGECETVYEIAPLSDALIRSDQKLNPVPQLCAEGTFFQVVKTKNYSKCRSTRPMFNVIAPSGWKCRPGVSTCDTALSRSSVNRYIACGSLESFAVLKITHQSEARVSPYAYETEQLRAISLMKLTLQAVRPASLAGSKVPNKGYDDGPLITSLVFTFPGSGAAGVAWRVDDLVKAPSLHDADQLQQISELKLDEVTHLLTSAANQIEGNQEDAAIDSISYLSELIRQFNYPNLISIWGDFDKKRPNERRVILDAVIAAGTNPAIMFLKEAILQHRLTKRESLDAIAGLPLYVRTPTQELLHELYNMIITLKDSSDRSIYHAAMLSVSQIVHIACVNVTEAVARFPTTLYGNFCQPNDTLIIDNLVSVLGKEIYFSDLLEDKLAALTALGEIGHEAIIAIVFPIIRATERYSTLLRTRAVISLHKLAHDSNEQALNVLSSTFHHSRDNSEVRMAAFTLMILANPPSYRWQRIAVSTWFEQDVQVASFVYTRIASLACSIHPPGNLKEMAVKAQIALPLVKRVPVGLRYSYSFKWSHMLPERNAGAEFHQEVFNSFDSLIPKSIYSRLSWALGPYHFDIFELEAYGGHWRNALERMSTKLFSYLEKSERRHVRNGHSPDSDLHPDLRRMKKQFTAKNLLPVLDTGSAYGFAHVNFMKSIHRFEPFEEADVLDFFQQLLSRSNVMTQNEFSHQKWMPFAHAEMLMPNNLGFLVEMRVQAHLLAVARGHIQAGLSNIPGSGKEHAEYSERSLGLTVDVRPKFIVKLHSSMGVKVDFAKAVISSGVDTQVSLNLPGCLSIGYDYESSRLVLGWKPVSSVGPTSLFHYNVRPFTCLRASDRCNAMNDEKEITTDGVTPQKFSYAIGGKTGLHLEYEIQSEAPMNADSFLNQLPIDFLTNLNFAFLPTSLYRKSYRVTLDPSKSDTKEIIFFTKIDVAKKLEKGTVLLNVGPKAQIAFSESGHRILFSTNKVDSYIKRKLNKVLSGVPGGLGVLAEAKFIFEAKDGSRKVYGASFAGALDNEGINVAVSAQLELPINQDNTDILKVCIEAGGHYPRFLSSDRRSLLENALEARWNASVGFGDMCDVQHQLTFKLVMKRSDSYSRYVLDSGENRECVLYESRGEYNHEQCRSVQQLAVVLDEYEANVKYGQVPPVLLNVAMRLESLLRKWFYAHMSENRAEVRNKEDELKIVLKVQPSLSTFDLLIFKPKSNVFFHGAPLCEMASILFPLNARSSVAEKIVDNTGNDGYSTICRIENSSITTFDKMQYNFTMNHCEHVVMAVQSTESFAVLIRQEEAQRVVTLLIDRSKLEILPAESKVRYNDEAILLSEEQPFEVYHADQSSTSQPSIGAYKVSEATYKVTAHYHDFHIFLNAAEGVVVKAPRSFQGKMIGLCGNMDGESVSELKDAQRCVLSSGDLMAASYRIHEPGKRCVSEEVRAQLREEQAACRSKHERVRSANDCFVRRTMVVHRHDAKCFSVTTVEECRPTCQRQSLRPFNIGFHCVPNSKTADKLAHEAATGDLIFMSDKKGDFQVVRYLPTVCQPIAGHSISTIT